MEVVVLVLVLVCSLVVMCVRAAYAAGLAVLLDLCDATGLV